MRLITLKLPMIPSGATVSDIISLGVLAGIGVYGVANSIFTVDSGHRAILYNRISGVKNKVFTEGAHFKLPWFEKPILYDVRSCCYVGQRSFTSRDRRMAKIGVRVVAHPIPEMLPTICRTVGPGSCDIILPVLAEETLLEVVPRFDSSELYCQNENINKEFHKKMAEIATKYHLGLDDVAITSIQFRKQNDRK